jgi:lysophospholipase L1-like esterase
MNVRVLASILVCASLAFGCGSPDSSAAEAESPAPVATSDGTATPLVVASAPNAAAQSVSRGGQAAGSGATTATTTTTATSTTTSTATANPLLTRTARILALGDSMTVGAEADPNGFRAYRGRLFALLGAAGYNVDFAGTQRLAPAIGGDPDHDGYGGAFIGPGGSSNNLADKLPAILSAVEPDIIILALGWNSVYNEPSVAASKYRDLVNRIAAAKPNAHIVVATLSPQRGQTEAQTNADLSAYAALNSAARSLASASTTDRIHLADYAAAGFQGSEYWDVIHWLQPGADRAAQVLYQTLVNGPLKR